MNWWAWVIAGAVLLGAELTFVNAQFYLVFIGSAAVVVGLISVLASSLSAWAQWAIFAVLALVSMVGFRSRIYDRLSAHAPAIRAGTTVSVLTLPEALAPGASCQAEHGGSFWTVRNDGDTAIAPGEHAHIVRREGLTLTVRSEHKAG
jgi:membrane protein implicated in regulation of membrane protease activity